MNLMNLPTDLLIPKNDGACDHLLKTSIPSISLPNQDGNYLKLNRKDTFRMALYCFPMTGRPDKPLPKNWDLIPGARGCTPQACSFRDHYDDLIKNNTLPVGISTQSIKDLKEMTSRLHIPYDLLSDQSLKFSSLLKLPTFSINNKAFIKRVTLISRAISN